MPPRGRRKPKAVVGDPNDPDGMGVWMKRYLDHLRVKNYSERTIENRECYLGFFVVWAEARSITRPQEVTKPILERYQRHLFHLRKDNGKPLSFRSPGMPSRPDPGVLQVARTLERPALEPGERAGAAED
jgi:integrase/recombinase XerD